MAVYYRIATRALMIDAMGGAAIPTWRFVGSTYTDQFPINNLLSTFYLSNENMVFGGTTIERLQDQIGRFVEGMDVVGWSRQDFLAGYKTSERDVVEAERVLYDPRPKTEKSTVLEEAKTRKRLEFLRFLYVQKPHLFNDGVEGEPIQVEDRL